MPAASPTRAGARAANGFEAVAPEPVEPLPLRSAVAPLPVTRSVTATPVSTRAMTSPRINARALRLAAEATVSFMTEGRMSALAPAAEARRAARNVAPTDPSVSESTLTGVCATRTWAASRRTMTHPTAMPSGVATARSTAGSRSASRATEPRVRPRSSAMAVSGPRSLLMLEETPYSTSSARRMSSSAMTAITLRICFSSDSIELNTRPHRGVAVQLVNGERRREGGKLAHRRRAGSIAEIPAGSSGICTMLALGNTAPSLSAPAAVTKPASTGGGW